LAKSTSIAGVKVWNRSYNKMSLYIAQKKKKEPLYELD